MKKTVFVWAMVALSLFSSCSFDARGEASDDFARSASSNVVENDVNSLDLIYNPDMGFYTAIEAIVDKDGRCSRYKSDEDSNLEELKKKISKKANGLKFDNTKSDWSKIIEDSSFNLLHLKVDLSPLSSRRIGTKKDEKIKDYEYINKKGEKKTGTLFKYCKELTAEKNKPYSGRYGKPEDIKDIKLKTCNIGEVLDAVEKAGKTCFIGFAYCWEGAKYLSGENVDKYIPVEPEDFDVILENIKVLCESMKGHEKAITGIMCRTLGPWGECHGTPYGEDKDKIAEVMHQWLECMKDNNLNVPLLVRRPSFIEYYKNKGYVDEYAVNIGVYNGAIFASWSDMNTFEGVKNHAGRKKYIEKHLAKYTEAIPYGSEISRSDDFKTSIVGTEGFSWEDAIAEMKKVHLSFANIGHKPEVLKYFYETPYVDKDNKTKYNYLTYIAKYMGYRYKISGREFDKDRSKGILTISFKIENEGFANMPFHREKVPYVYILKEGEKPVSFSEGIKITSQKLNWQTKSMSFDVPISGYEPGKYDIYIRFDDEEPSKIAPNGAYAIRFTGREWNEVLHAHKIKTMTL